MNSNINTANSSKLFWINCIKIFATFLVVMQHSISHEWVRLLDIGGSQWNIINFIFMLTRTGVPIFIMCSGMGMLSKERTVKSVYMNNIKNLVCLYIAWMLVFGIVDVCSMLSSPLATVRTVINALLKSILFGQYHTWFIIMLLALYAITPLLYEIAKRKNLLQYFLLLSILFTILLPYVRKVEALSRVNTVIQNANMNFVVGHTLYYMIGYYLSGCKLTKKRGLAACLMFILSAGAAFTLSNYQRSIVHSECQSVYAEFSVLGFMMNISIFMVFRFLIENVKPGKVIHSFVSVVVKCGIGIYLFHPLILFLVKNLHGSVSILGGIGIWALSVTVMVILYHLPVVSRIFLGKR
ncbi:MAG: hypothetical protein E7290_12100 [Lachnospiraceae bacterium]|nr:hypothetical protein [Lachnospiraceae bacterium]